MLPGIAEESDRLAAYGQEDVDGGVLSRSPGANEPAMGRQVKSRADAVGKQRKQEQQGTAENERREGPKTWSRANSSSWLKSSKGKLTAEQSVRIQARRRM